MAKWPEQTHISKGTGSRTGSITRDPIELFAYSAKNRNAWQDRQISVSCCNTSSFTKQEHYSTLKTAKDEKAVEIARI
jgi:hypothetical protein